MNEQYTHIDLFSGIGGFALAARWTGFKTIVFCEKDEWCQKILAKNFGAEVVSDSTSERLGRRGENCTGIKTGLLGQNVEQGTVVADTASKRCRETRRDCERSTERIASKCKIPIIPDIHDFDGSKWHGATLLTGGFPCQPFSCAGKRGGKADDRFLWPEMVRVIAETRPTWVIGENVRGIVTMELDRVLSDLEGIGYSCWPVIIPACAVDAKHRRDRVWIICHAKHAGFNAAKIARSIEQRSNGNEAGTKQTGKPARPSEQHGIVAHTEQFGRRGRCDGNEAGDNGQIQIAGPCATDKPEDVANPNSQRGCLRPTDRTDASDVRKPYCTWQDEADWFAQSGMGRVASRIPNRVDRLKGLGNAIVPAVAAELMRMIMEVEINLPLAPGG